MSSFYEDASLVMIPSGYKTSKVYCAKPTDGTGDLTFTRSNDTATRVNSAGLIEKVRTNLVTYSNDFSNAAWAKTNFNLTGGQSDPFGGSNAWKAECTSTSGGILQTAAGSGIRVASVYAKAGNVSTFSLWRGSVVAAGVSFNLANGTIISGVGTITSVGGGWYRCSTFADTAQVNPYFNTPTSGDFIYIAFSQLENGDVATDYIATTSAAVSVGPVANVPRLDYLNSSCPRLLLEPQRQNVITFSEQMDNAAWNKIQSSVTANAGTSPDGYTNADKFIPNTSNVIHFVTQTISSVSASWTYSIFAKAAGYDRLILNAFNTNYVGFNLTSGIVESSLGTGVTSANIENYGNGWYRCSITSTSTATGTNVAISVFNAAYTNGNTNPQFAGNGTDGILIYGAQLEQGSYSTSLIPTLGAAVTRGADACSKTGITSLIGQTEGTMFLDVVAQVDTAESQDFSISDGTANNRASIRLNNSGLINAIGVFGGSVQFSMGTGAYVTGQRYKIALAYKLNDVVLYVNGVQSATDTSATISGTLSRLGFDVNTTGTQNLKSRVNQTLLFKTRLTNSELAALTTL